MTEQHDEELRAMLALDAVGALSEEERVELVEELRDRPDLRAELDELRAVAALMIVEEAPSPTLRASVLETVGTTDQEPATEQEPTLAPVVRMADRRRTRWFAAGAAAAAVVALVVGAVVVVSDDSETDDEVAAVLEDSAARTIALDGELTGLSIVHSTQEDAAVLTGSGVPVPEGERVYELWAMRGSAAPEPVTTFRPSDGGAVALYLAGIDPDSAQWAITEEPAGGSPTPTPPILATTV